MKILLYTGYRTGSKTLGLWLEEELNIKYYHEPLNISVNSYPGIDIYKLESGIIKISPIDNFVYDDNINFFDKIIVLYRIDTLAQAESMVWALDKKVWQFGDNFSSNYYNISEYLNFNKQKIINWKNHMDSENEYLKTLKNCIHITYENLFYSKIDIKKIENYLHFKSKSFPNPISKLRDNKKRII